MDICPELNVTSTIIDGFPLALWNVSLAHLALCGGNTYLRPDAGAALQPYIWTIMEIILHIPTCIVRLARWEKAQILSLCIAALNIIITTQAYTSTKLDTSQVLVWNPVVLILDAGAMLQIHILILEKIKFRGFLRGLQRGATLPFRALSSRIRARFGRGTMPYNQTETTEPEGVVPSKSLLEIRHDEEKGAGISTIPSKWIENEEENELGHDAGDTIVDAITPNSTALATERHAAVTTIVAEASDSSEGPRPSARAGEDVNNSGQMTIIASLALLMLLYIIALQVVGLANAVEGSKVQNLTATWCSPDFQPMALAVIDGNCKTRPIVESSSSGIGCIKLPAMEERAWLLKIIIIISLSLAFQFIDFCVLTLSDSKARTCHQKVKMQRPWLTTFGGMIVLIVLTMDGIYYANHLPSSITERVIVLRRDRGLDIMGACEGILTSSGLRGAFIGYLDGLFRSWGWIYFGKSSGEI